MTIYVASRYTAPTEEERQANVDLAMDAGLELIKRGHSPFVPVLSHYLDLHAQRQRLHLPWETWMEVVSAFVPLCEGFLYLSSSRGADIELLMAKATNRRIFYGLDEVPTAE